MHEVGLITSLMGQVGESAAAHGIAKVLRVKLVVGKLTMAQPDFLRFAFETLSPGTIFEGAALEIEERPVVLRCVACTATISPEGMEYFCPACGGRLEIQSGDELFIEYYEGETEEENCAHQGSNGPASA